MKIQTTTHFEQLEGSDKRISVHQGGSRSGKTFNILFWFIIKLLNEDNKTLTICRKTLPSLKSSAYRDFLWHIDNLQLYSKDDHNKTDMTYKIGTNLVEFISLDQPQKIRGRKRDYLFINEANEITIEDWRQLSFRTSGKIVLDYNPSDEFHFIYDEIIPRDDCDFTKTTYKDNPFNPIEVVREIERLKDVDPHYWRVYGLGERGISEATIFRNWDTTEDYENVDAKEIFGLDFGYNDPTALIKMKRLDKQVPEIYVKQCFYKTHLTSDEIKSLTKDYVEDHYKKIYGDSARPEIIEDIKREGLNILSADKGKNSVKDSIDYLQKHKIFIDEESLDLIKEMRMYKWQVHSDGRVLDVPVDINNHLVDALRYAAYSSRPNKDNFQYSFV